MPEIQKTSEINIYFRVLGYLKPYYRQFIFIILFNFVYIIFNTVSIWMIAPFVSTLFESQDKSAVEQVQPTNEPEQDVSIFDINEWMKIHLDSLFRRDNPIRTLQLLCVFIFLAFALKNAAHIMEIWLVSFVEQKVIKDLRDEVYSHILWQPLGFFSKYQIGNIISRITNDINALNTTLNTNFTRIIREPLVIFIFVAILVSISWQLTLVAMLVIPLTGILISKIGQSLKRKSKRVQERIADITTIIEETISGIKIVKAFSMERYESGKFQKKTTEHFHAAFRQSRLNRLSSPVSETLGIGIMVAVLWFGGRLVLTGELISSEDFIRFLAVLFSVMAPIKSLGEFNNEVQISLASAKRIFTILDEPVEVIDQPDALEKKMFEQAVEYQDVSFRYTPKDEYVLQNVDLTIHRNQKVAFVGSSGAGKTTLVNLLPRFFDVTGGSITIDGQDIREIKMSSLRRLLGIVTQEVILFNDTVSNNIAYGIADYGKEQIEKAARLANAYQFIMELPEGFDTIIGEKGMRLSGGQRQRISIARAILKNPPILIFDEATSSLDSEAELQIQEAIDNLMEDRTVFIIAHRLSSIIKSDKIIVLEEGRIIDSGTHKELLGRSERYKYLYELQFSA
jgi:subfamily B ATP-binding cassette protein MsbA